MNASMETIQPAHPPGTLTPGEFSRRRGHVILELRGTKTRWLPCFRRPFEGALETFYRGRRVSGGEDITLDGVTLLMTDYGRTWVACDIQMRVSDAPLTSAFSKRTEVA